MSPRLGASSQLRKIRFLLLVYIDSPVCVSHDIHRWVGSAHAAGFLTLCTYILCDAAWSKHGKGTIGRMAEAVRGWRCMLRALMEHGQSVQTAAMKLIEKLVLWQGKDMTQALPCISILVCKRLQQGWGLTETKPKFAELRSCSVCAVPAGAVNWFPATADAGDVGTTWLLRSILFTRPNTTLPASLLQHAEGTHRGSTQHQEIMLQDAICTTCEIMRRRGKHDVPLAVALQMKAHWLTSGTKPSKGPGHR